MSLRSSFRGVHALIAALFLSVMLVAACSPDPTATPVPTSTPEPTATPLPTATPEPTATAEPTATPMPPPDMMPGLMIDENTLGSDIVAMMSEAEVECLRGALGDETYAAMQAAPVLMFADALEMVATCFSPELSAGIALSVISAQVGGLSAESGACLKDFYAEHGATGPNDSDPAAGFIYMFTFQMCLTDEEAMAFAGGDESMPLPSELRCLTSQTSIENLTILLSGLEALFTGNASPEMLQALQELQAASEVCGVDLISQG